MVLQVYFTQEMEPGEHTHTHFSTDLFSPKRQMILGTGLAVLAPWWQFTIHETTPSQSEKCTAAVVDAAALTQV